ncbi:hypothetical protein RRF57_006243 [Xylaria bambusicola]|uniref:Cep57 centrosome microtubule-binding domain-containing protein n=1 Tax=Xylaria bambusicola TaxID=326684 RepID=A0AAN7UQ26_9PEZI
MSVTDRAKKQTSTSDYTYEDQPTLRPSQDPAIAFAKVKKVLEDEKKHLELDLAQKMADYNTCDAAVGKRHWRKLDAEITILRKRLALKREQIYNLHDVEVNLEKANGQWTIPETVDMTIASVMSKDPTWNGIY